MKKNLAKLGLHTIRDLLEHRPHRYEAAAEEVRIADLLAGEEEVAIAGEVRKTSVRRTSRRLSIVQARIADESGEITAVWFNQVWLAEKLQPGTRVRLRGQLKRNEFTVRSYDLNGVLGDGRLRAGLPGERGRDGQEAARAGRQGAAARTRLPGLPACTDRGAGRASESSRCAPRPASTTRRAGRRAGTTTARIRRAARPAGRARPAAASAVRRSVRRLSASRASWSRGTGSGCRSS